MADVAERGQLILITGLVIAIAFVALTLLLNTAIYTENLASRGSEVGAREAIELRETTVESLGNLLDAENDVEYSSQDAVYSAVSNDLDEYDRLRSIRIAETGRLGSGSTIAINNGTLLRQTNASRTMVDAPKNERNWTLATGVDDTRRFVVSVSGFNGSTSDPKNESFRVAIEGSTNSWNVYLYDDGGTTKLAVKNGSQADPTTGVCSPSATPTVNLSAGTVDGTQCSALEFAKGVSPTYDIKFYWGNTVEGTYNLTVNTSSAGASIESSNFNSVGGNSPYKVPAIYSLHYRITYSTDELWVRDTLRIAPGEPP